MDPEHLDFYGTVEAMNRAYEDYVRNIPFYGFAVLCVDHPAVQAMIPRLPERRIVTYGMSPQADVRAVNIDLSPGGATFDVIVADRIADTEHAIGALTLTMHGAHHVQKSLDAITLPKEMRIDDDTRS